MGPLAGVSRTSGTPAGPFAALRGLDRASASGLAWTGGDLAALALWAGLRRKGMFVMRHVARDRGGQADG